MDGAAVHPLCSLPGSGRNGPLGAVSQAELPADQPENTPVQWAIRNYDYEILVNNL